MRPASNRTGSVTDVTITAAGMRIVKLLVGQVPQTVSALIDQTGVTRTAVTEQLNELVAAGFVERNIERLTGRGRPRHLYTATTAALVLLFANNQHLIMPAIWQAMREVAGEETTKAVLKRVSRILAAHYRQKLTAKKPEERLRQLARVMEEEGSLVEIDGASGHIIMHKRSCPFISMYEGGELICHVDEDFLADVVGAPVTRIACRHEGAACCSFGLTSQNGDRNCQQTL